MSDFIAVWAPPGDAAGEVRHLTATLSSTRRWIEVHRGDGLVVWSRAHRPLAVRLLAGRGLVLGQISDAADAVRRLDAGRDTEGLARQLTRTLWGRYVALLGAGPARAPAILRDPSGALDALVWRRGPLVLAASELVAELDAHLPVDVAIDTTVLARFVTDTIALADPVALRGVESVAAGALWRPDAPQIQIWSPSRFARLAPPDLETARRQLVDSVSASVAAAAPSGGSPVLAQVSGGIDSGIVASLLAGHSAPVATWLNVRIDDVEGDERLYARAIAAHCGFTLTEVDKQGFSPAEDPLETPGVRPSLTRFDTHYDDRLADLAAQAGAGAIITGQGGDAIFHQAKTPLASLDIWRPRGSPDHAWTTLLDVARWNRVSVWSLARLALAARLRPRALSWRAMPAYLTATARAIAAAAPVHPWLSDLDDLAPAKRLQILDLTAGQLQAGACGAARQIEFRHPLLAQPVMEASLAIPATDHIRGGLSRGLARQAFADRLPQSVLHRQTKGGVSGHVGRTLAAALPDLRGRLLEGHLAQAGLLAPDRLAPLLTRERLAIDGGYADLVELMAIERWASQWTVRLARGRAQQRP